MPLTMNDNHAIFLLWKPKTGVNTMEWRDIPKYAKYQASECGKIRNKKSGRILIPWETDKGYLKVTVYGRVDRFVHRLVFAAHEHEIPDGMCINHTNRDKQDNCIDNLECVTAAENNAHSLACRIADGTAPIGALLKSTRRD